VLNNSKELQDEKPRNDDTCTFLETATKHVVSLKGLENDVGGFSVSHYFRLSLFFLIPLI
jgi:hypothetical protein